MVAPVVLSTYVNLGHLLGSIVYVVGVDGVDGVVPPDELLDEPIAGP